MVLLGWVSYLLRDIFKLARWSQLQYTAQRISHMMNLPRLSHHYISSKLVQQLRSHALGQSVWERVKAELKVGKLIMAQGYGQAKQDIALYWAYHMATDPTMRRTPELRQQIDGIGSDLLKVPPVAILFCLPGGLPLVLAYMACLPALTPTWFLLDSHRDSVEEAGLRRQLQALQYFVDCKGVILHRNGQQTEISTLLNLPTFQQMSLAQQQRVMQLCFGTSFDGTNIINNSLGTKFKYFISKPLSSLLMARQLQQKLSHQQFQLTQSQDALQAKVLRQCHKLIKLHEDIFDVS